MGRARGGVHGAVLTGRVAASSPRSRNQRPPRKVGSSGTAAATLQPVGTRGDFSVSFQHSRWAEDQTIGLLQQMSGVVVVHYGASRTEIPGGPLTRAQYVAQHQATETHGKRPDLLVFTEAAYRALAQQYPGKDGRPLIDQLEGTPDTEIPHEILTMASAAVEVENSIRDAKDMRDYGQPAPQAFKGTPYDGLGFTERAQLPHVYLKVTDLKRLRQWREYTGVHLLVSSVFPDASYLLDLERAEQAIADGAIQSGTTNYSEREEHATYRIWYTLAVELGDPVVKPEITPVMIRHGKDGGGKIEFAGVISGGEWKLTDDARDLMAPLVAASGPARLPRKS